jgi:hypothetical protein
MCDYSLMGVPNRLATDGEELVVHRFLTGTIGLVSPVELGLKAQQQNFLPKRSWWARLKEWFEMPAGNVTAVCVPPGTRLVLRDIPHNLQNEFRVGIEEEVTFVQLNASEYSHRDAVRFRTGSEVLLQRLREGQRVQILSVGPGDDFDRPWWEDSGVLVECGSARNRRARVEH